MKDQKDYNQGVGMLNGLETAFECASMCGTSKYYAFSNVEM